MENMLLLGISLPWAFMVKGLVCTLTSSPPPKKQKQIKTANGKTSGFDQNKGVAPGRTPLHFMFWCLGGVSDMVPIVTTSKKSAKSMLIAPS